MSPATATVKPRGDFCPVCERFIGPAAVCPYCDEESARSGMLKVMRRAALILGLAGLALLYVAASHSTIPVMPIENITPMMNFAHVRVVGEVARRPFISRKRGEVDYLSFLVTDRGNELRVTANRDVARTLVERKAVPEKGAWVDVAGTLNISGGGRKKLRLYTADMLTIKGREESE